MKSKKYILTSILTLSFLLITLLFKLFLIAIIFTPLIWGAIFTLVNKVK